MTKSWIVVADSSRARIFSAESSNSGLTEIEDLAHPESRLQDKDINADAPGRSPDGPGGRSRHSVGEDKDPKQYQAQRFAKRVCENVEAARQAGRFEKLYVVAAPAFLGLLRDAMPPAARGTVAIEVDKNLTTHPVDDIRAHLPRYL